MQPLRRKADGDQRITTLVYQSHNGNGL